MANLSLREAVKAFDVSRPTLTKALNSGKLSGVRNSKGQWEIAPSELARVYQARITEAEGANRYEQAKFTTTNTALNMELEKLKADLALAEARAKAAETLALERAERIEDLRRMLPAPNGKETAPRRRSWWPFSKD